MILKPKKNECNEPAIWFKRTTVGENATTIEAYNVYKTSDGKYWAFDANKEKFVEWNKDDNYGAIIDFTGGSLSYITIRKSIVCNYNKKWEYQTVYGLRSLLAEFYPSIQANVMKSYSYTKNSYFNQGPFSWTMKGSIDNFTAQPIKGLMTNAKSLQIRTDDDIDIMQEDLVVLNKRLYSVESIEISIKKQPRPLEIRYLTLNSIF